MITIENTFESSNIVVEAVTNSDVQLSIRPDTNAQYFQWFYFRAIAPTDIQYTYRILNAFGASYHQAWIGYRVLASYDDVNWFRIPTRYDGSHLIWSLKPKNQVVSFAFFVPYQAHQRETLLQEATAASHITQSLLGKSLNDQDIMCLTIGDSTDTTKKVVWVVARQHAGETMAEYAAEGLIRRLMELDDVGTKQLLQQAVIYVVPNLNPDGSVLGNLRANAAGVDLNRIWDSPAENSPEIGIVLEEMGKTGVDYFLDIHGDEERPYLWMESSTHNPDLDIIHNKFKQYFWDHFPEMGETPEEIVSGVMEAPGMSIQHMEKRFGCPGWVIELPFKETPVGDTLLPDGCMRFGHACVDALLHSM